jgi:hypothetical protein
MVISKDMSGSCLATIVDRGYGYPPFSPRMALFYVPVRNVEVHEYWYCTGNAKFFTGTVLDFTQYFIGFLIYTVN